MTKIRTLLDTHSYSAALIPPLKEYLRHMGAGTAPYAFDAVRTLVKLYTLFPQSAADADADAVEDEDMGRACLLALTYGSAHSDMHALRLLIPTAVVVRDGRVARVLECAACFEAAQYTEFWSLFLSLPMELPPDATTTLQRAIAATIAGTMAQAPAPYVRAALHLSSSYTNDKLLLPLLQGIVEEEEDGIVTFVRTADNAPRPRAVPERLAYATVGAALRAVSQ